MAELKYFSLLEDSNAYKTLQKSISDDKMAKAYLFVSSDTLSVRILSRLFAASAINADLQLVNDNLHADVKIFPDIDEKGGQKNTVYTSDIDQLLSTVHIRPSKGEKKFYIIDYGETMNASCQNKLLKTLEEPPDSVYIIINCNSVSRILPTIISRCRKIETDIYSETVLKNYLSHSYSDSKKLELAISLSGGQLLTADKILNDNKYEKLFENAVTILLDLKSSKNVLVNAAKMLNYKDRLSDILEFFVLLFRDVLVFNNNQRQLVSLKEYLPQIEHLSKMYSTSAILEIMPAISHSQERIKGYGNTNSIIDELLMKIVMNKAKYKNA